MKLVFKLPSGGSGLPANMYKNKLALQLRHWCLTNKTDCTFGASKNYEMPVEFTNESDYTKFLLTFSWDGLFGKPKLTV
jgi:hypothetical protein